MAKSVSLGKIDDFRFAYSKNYLYFCTFFHYSYMHTTTINHLKTSLPLWTIELAFGFMLLSALLSPTPITDWFYAHCAWLKAIINTTGDVIFYWAFWHGMKKLYKPLTAWWIALLTLVCAGFVTTSLLQIAACYEIMELAGVVVAMVIPLVYIPLGMLLLLYYKGALAYVGVGMIIKCIVSNILPVILVLLGWNDVYWVLDVLFVVTLAVYAYLLRRCFISSL